MKTFLLLMTLTCSQQILSEQELHSLNSNLPPVEDDEYREKLSGAIFYDHRIGVAYQAGILPEAANEPIGFVAANLNISGDGSVEAAKPDGQGGNPNTSTHVWAARPGGTHRTNTKAVTAFWLPRKPDGSHWPVILYREPIPNIFFPGTVRAWNWTFPYGTTFFELLFMPGPGGRDFCYEIRVRQRDIDAWIPDILVPFPEATDLAEAIKERRPSWRFRPQLATAVGHLEDPSTVVRGRFRDRNRDENVIDVVAGVDNLPELGDDNLVADLLYNTLFRSAMGTVWKQPPGGLAANAPTTSADFHIIPKNYDGTFLGRDTESCSRCHGTTLTSARRWDANIGWYGYVRGNRVDGSRGGGIFSWHPVEPGTLTRFVKTRNENGVLVSNDTLNREWLRAGILEMYDEQRHPSDHYRRLSRGN